jgi:hypothetical protein
MHEKDKLEEAKYFFSKMQNEKENPAAFKHNLSAGLSSARSVGQYALDEAKTKTGGQKWYDGLMKSSPILTFFKNKRNYNIHTAPVVLLKHRSITLTEIIRASESITIEIKDKDGKLIGVRMISDPPNSQIPEGSSATSETVYRFDDWAKGEDVIALCSKYMAELERFIQEGIDKGYISG